MRCRYKSFWCTLNPFPMLKSTLKKTNRRFYALLLYAAIDFVISGRARSILTTGSEKATSKTLKKEHDVTLFSSTNI